MNYDYYTGSYNYDGLFGALAGMLAFIAILSLAVAIFGIIAQDKFNFSEAFGVTPQAVYGNINRLAQLEARIDAQPDIPADCIILTQKDIDKLL